MSEAITGRKEPRIYNVFLREKLYNLEKKDSPFDFLVAINASAFVNYSVNIELEDPESELLDETCYFTNAEMYHRYFSVNPGNVISRPAALRKLVFGWKSKGYFYSCYIYFNEEETFRNFQEAFDGDESKGEFKIFVSKYNNYLELSLTVGDKKYRFENMQIDIANRERFYDSADRVYENYEGAHQDFVGR